jgi:type IV pilus assembly protein PilM
MGSMKKTTLNTRKTYFFEDRPLFGLDIGHNKLRVMQLDLKSKQPRLKGYGATTFDAGAIADGVIVKPELIAKAAKELFAKGMVGDISTKRVAVSLPAGRAFTRAVQLPKMNARDIGEAVQTEAEQYMPAGADNLYLDYTTIHQDDDGIEVFITAMPKKIVDSYLLLTRMLGLEAVLFDTAIGASARLFALDRQSNIPSVLIDFGAQSTDITVFNRGLVVTGTVAFGGDDITKSIAGALHVTPNEAIMLKINYGLSSSVVQHQVITAMRPSLELLIKEIRRTIRYYEQRYPKEPPIGQVVTMGGGANMPGLASYLTEWLRLPVRSFDPASHINFGQLRPLYSADHMSFVTVAGLAATNPAEIFA